MIKTSLFIIVCHVLVKAGKLMLGSQDQAGLFGYVSEIKLEKVLQLLSQIPGVCVIFVVGEFHMLDFFLPV